MGLIKTAMMTGGGIYAVKQLAKTAERRHDNGNNNSQGSRDPGYPNQQGYWGHPGPQGPPPPRPYYQDQREWSTYNQTDERYPPRNPYGPAESYDQKRAYREEDNQYQYQYQSRDRMAGQPPSYYPDQQPQQQGYTTGPSQEENSRGGGSGGPAGLAGMALEFVGSGNRAGGNGKQLEKGTQLVSEFFGK